VFWREETCVLDIKYFVVFLCYICMLRLKGNRISNSCIYRSSCPPPQHKIINSVALVHERTILTERPLLVDKVIANFCG
jgi:hypothetical protein